MTSLRVPGVLLTVILCATSCTPSSTGDADAGPDDAGGAASSSSSGASSSSSTSSGGGGQCEDTCQWANDQTCDDSRGTGVCADGTDCLDCGPFTGSASSSSSSGANSSSASSSSSSSSAGASSSGGGTAFNPRFKRVGRRVAAVPTNSIILNYAPISLSANAGCIVFNTNRAAATSGASLPDSEDTVFLVDTTPTATPEHIVVTSDEALGSTAATNPSSRNARRAVSADCSRVVFKTNRNLDAASPVGDSVYLRDRNAGTTSRVSFTDGYPTRLYAISISTDGSTVTFDDSKEGRTDGPPFTNPGEAWAFDVAAGTRRWITDVDGSSYSGPKVFLNQDGSRAALYTQQIRRLVSGSYSTTCNGGCVSLLNTVTREARTALDTMGLAYDNTPDSMLASHDMTRLVVRQGRSLYWFDVGTGERRLVNPGRGTSQPPTSGSLENYQFDINADGRYVVFAYSGTTLVGPDGVGDHLYRWDANTSTLELLTVNADGSLPSAVIGVTPVTPTIEQVSVDATGQVVAFVSGESVGFGNGLAAGTNDGRETGLWLWDNR